jgi:hypothetical protein
VKSDEERFAEAVAAVPMLDTVGALRVLLEQLPDDMPLILDDHPRALPGEPDMIHTVHARLIGFVSGLGTPEVETTPGVMLTQVYVPNGTDEEQASVASRHDLPPYGEFPRAAHHLEQGELGPGLKDVAEVLDEVAHLVGTVAAEYVETGSDAARTLKVEAERITYSAARVVTLADTVESAE